MPGTQHKKIRNAIGIWLLFLAGQLGGMATGSPASPNDDSKETANKAQQSESSRLPAVHLDGGYFVRDGKRFSPVGAHWVPAKAAMHWPLEWDPKGIEGDFAKMHELGYNIVRLIWFGPGSSRGPAITIQPLFSSWTFAPLGHPFAFQNYGFWRRVSTGGPIWLAYEIGAIRRDNC
jgi:hypothetical protein